MLMMGLILFLMVFEKKSPSIAHLDFALFLVDEDSNPPFFTANHPKRSAIDGARKTCRDGAFSAATKKVLSRCSIGQRQCKIEVFLISYLPHLYD
jgi:hypothetical protein